MPVGDVRKPSAKELRRARQALRELSSRFPHGEDIYGVLLGLADQKIVPAAIDRTITIVGVSFLENALEKVIRWHLRKDLNPTDKNKLFNGGQDGTGILTDFAARIDIAYALGALKEDTRDDDLGLSRSLLKFARQALPVK
jgi:hypothetical protein